MLVGPASSFRREQMNVTFLRSRHVTGIAAVQQAIRIGFLIELSGVAVLRAGCPLMRSASRSDPSHHTMSRGRVMRAVSSTHCSSGVDDEDGDVGADVDDNDKGALPFQLGRGPNDRVDEFIDDKSF